MRELLEEEVSENFVKFVLRVSFDVEESIEIMRPRRKRGTRPINVDDAFDVFVCPMP